MILKYKFLVTDLNGDGHSSLEVKVVDKRGKYVTTLYTDYWKMRAYITDRYSLFYNAQVEWCE